jgi:hypothetical protein
MNSRIKGPAVLRRTSGMDRRDTEPAHRARSVHFGPDPLFLSPPWSFLTVAHAMRAALRSGAPRASDPASMWRAIRRCFPVYLFVLPCAVPILSLRPGSCARCVLRRLGPRRTPVPSAAPFPAGYLFTGSKGEPSPPPAHRREQREWSPPLRSDSNRGRPVAPVTTLVGPFPTIYQASIQLVLGTG